MYDSTKKKFRWFNSERGLMVNRRKIINSIAHWIFWTIGLLVILVGYGVLFAMLFPDRFERFILWLNQNM